MPLTVDDTPVMAVAGRTEDFDRAEADSDRGGEALRNRHVCRRTFDAVADELSHVSEQ